MTQVQNAAASLYGLYAINTSAATAWIQCFDAANAGAVTLGTTSPDVEFYVLAGGQGPFLPLGTPQAFSSGIFCASTTAEKGSSASASGVILFASYK